MEKETVSIFYACDEAFVKCTIVSLYSMIQNASDAYQYRVHILHTDITPETQARVSALQNDNFRISFDDVTDYLHSIAEKLPLRDYYSKTTYYRLFIAEMFPDLKRAIYIDSDTVVQGDISELYRTDIGDAYLGACHEQAMVQVDEYGTYAERVVGVSRHNFFNAGMILINCEQFRQHAVLDQFFRYLHIYNFAVTQDEDYLNLICKDHVYFLDQRWNTEIFGEIPYPIEEAKILHYIMVSKPWHYADCRHGDIFWHYAKQTSEYEELLRNQQVYTDEERARDAESCERLLQLAVDETNRADNFVNIRNAEHRAQDRVEILKKIDEYEAEGRFDEDVEDDPPGKVLMPEDINYLDRSLIKRIKTKIAYNRARKFVYGLLDDKKMIVKEIRGIEHFKNLDSGAIVTCNHFNPYDSFAIQLAYEASGHKGERTFYRVIREGNYTSFPGFYGFLMRNYNTLPLSSNRKTLKKFMEATDTLLKEGHFVLVYPEQSMWWNYRKPKPLKTGAYSFAVRANVPVLPCFITMKDTDIMGDDGFFVQEYTIHIAPPIYPDQSKPYAEAVKELLDQNYAIWKDIYEKEYQMPLSYLCDKK